jgi:hypothetical protein
MTKCKCGHTDDTHNSKPSYPIMIDSGQGNCKKCKCETFEKEKEHNNNTEINHQMSWRDKLWH